MLLIFHSKILLEFYLYCLVGSVEPSRVKKHNYGSGSSTILVLVRYITRFLCIRRAG